MRFMMMVKGNREYEAGAPPKPELMMAMAKLTEEGMKAGYLLETGGLLPSAMGAMLRLDDGKISVTDGPFPETKEVVGGYAIVRANSKEEAIGYGKRFLEVHREVLGSSCQIETELRQLADFGPEPR